MPDKKDVDAVSRLRFGYVANTSLMLLLYAAYGLNFLLLPGRTSLVQYGGVLASPTFWGVTFLVVAIIMSQSLLRPDIHWLYVTAQCSLIGHLVLFLFVRTIIVGQTGLDFISPILWFVLLGMTIVRMIATVDAAEIMGVPFVGKFFGGIIRKVTHREGG